MERIRTTLVYVLLTLVTAVALFPIGYMLLIAGGEGERFAEGGQTLFQRPRARCQATWPAIWTP